METPTINEIQTQILAQAAASADLPATEVLTQDEQANIANLTSTSKVSIFRLIIYIVAVITWSVYKLWETLSLDLDERLAVSRPFTKGWYAVTALNYQHGHTLPETGIYDNTGLTIAQINDAKIIDKAAIVETIINGHGILRIKVAKQIDQGDLEKLSPTEIAGFQEYMNNMGAAGVSVEASSKNADNLKVDFKIYFDATILDNQGKRLDGTNDTPVQSAIDDYLKVKNSDDFNGELSITKLTDQVQAVVGVTDVFLQQAWSAINSFDYTQNNNNTGIIDEFRQPDSGYFKLDTVNSIFTFIPR